MSDNPVKEEVENFNRRSLKKTEMKEYKDLPTKEEIERERNAQEEQKQNACEKPLNISAS